MEVSSILRVLAVMETGMVLALCVVFFAKGLHRQFRWMAAYLTFHFISTLYLAIIETEPIQTSSLWYKVYFYSYWTNYLVSAVLIFGVCVEVFCVAMAPLEGMKKTGLMIFRWAGVISIIFALISLANYHESSAYAYIINQAFRAVSMIELCLLAFLALSLDTLGLSVRSRAFGIALGFGLLSTNDFVFALFAPKIEMDSPLQLLFESIILSGSIIWMLYTVQTEPARKPLALPVNSLIYRWNTIATALGHTGTAVLVDAGDRSILADVEEIFETARPEVKPISLVPEYKRTA